MTHAHAIVVHFPIALLATSVVLELLAIHPKLRESLGTATLITLLLGAGGAALAVMTGPDRNLRSSTIGHTHEQFAQLTLLIFGILALWRLFMAFKHKTLGKLVAVYLVLSLAGLGTLTYTGLLGGQMVYEEAIGVSRNGQLVVPPKPFTRRPQK